MNHDNPDQRNGGSAFSLETARLAIREAAAADDAQRLASLLHRWRDRLAGDPALLELLGDTGGGTAFLHRVRQAYQRLPVPPFDDPALASARVREWLGPLERDGILKVSGLIPHALLQTLQRDFSRKLLRLSFLRRLRLRRFTHYDMREYWHPEHRDYVINDALDGSAALLELCCHPEVIETVNFYLRKPGNLKRVTGMRYLPSVALDSSQFGWHHDMEDRQLKMMVLLTDIGEEDQFMAYVRGSHLELRPYANYLRNSLAAEAAPAGVGPLEMVKTLGVAGDVFFFDSNGKHRACRSPSAVRDALFIEFTADRNRGNYWGTAMDRSLLPAAGQTPGHPMEVFLDVKPKWKRHLAAAPRQRPTWAETLENPATWL